MNRREVIEGAAALVVTPQAGAIGPEIIAAALSARSDLVQAVERAAQRVAAIANEEGPDAFAGLYRVAQEIASEKLAQFDRGEGPYYDLIHYGRTPRA